VTPRHQARFGAFRLGCAGNQALPKSEQLVRVFGTQPTLPTAPTSPANFLEWKTENAVFERIATYVGQGFNLTGTDKPERVIGVRVWIFRGEVLSRQEEEQRAALGV